jgi:hypothetical protein
MCFAGSLGGGGGPTALLLLSDLANLVHWRCVSPHHHDSSRQSALATELDKKLGSFYVWQVFGNMLVAALSLHNCTKLDRSFIALDISHDLSFFAISVVGTNLLCHRYLLSKAEIMTADLTESEQSSGCLLSLDKLKTVFLWEIRVLPLVPLAVVLFFTVPSPDNETAAFSIGGIACAMIMILDILFTVMITAIFILRKPLPPSFPPLSLPSSSLTKFTAEGPLSRSLSPPAIHNILRVGELVPPSHILHAHSSAHRRLQRTKWMALVGTALALGSSTLLYINGLLYFSKGLGLAGDTYNNDPEKNVYVLGGNLDSIFNDFGMLLVSGIFRNGCFNVMATTENKEPSFSKGSNSEHSNVLRTSLLVVSNKSSYPCDEYDENKM